MLIRVVYHLIAKTGWSNIAVNGTHQSPEWTFPWDVRVPFPRTFPQVRINAKRPRNSRKELMERTFSVWKFRLGILDYLSRNPVFSGNFPFWKTKLPFPFIFSLFLPQPPPLHPPPPPGVFLRSLSKSLVPTI